MAITATEVPTAVADRSATTKRWNVISTLDADTALVVPHGMGALPGFDVTKVKVWLQGVLAPGRLSDWIAVIDATNITITATTAVGSGDAAIQAHLFAELPHSIL